MYKNKNGTWCSDFIMDGVRFQRRYPNSTKAEALRFEKEWKERIRKGKAEDELWETDVSSARGGMKLSEALDFLHDRYWQYLDDTTHYRVCLNRVIKAIGDKEVSELTTADLYELKDKMLNKGVNDKVYSPHSFNSSLVALGTALRILEGLEVVKFKSKPNFKGLQARQVIPKRPALRDDELLRAKEFLYNRAKKSKALSSVEIYELFIVLSNLGLRPAEYFAIELGDISFEYDTITISKAIKTHKGTGTIIGAPKNGHSRTLPCGENVMEVFRAIKQRLEIAKSVSKAEARRLFTETKDDQVLKMTYYWVSQGAYDNCKDLPLDKCPITHLNHDTANRMWWAVRNHLGYAGTSNTHGLYVLRHTVASRLVSLKGFNAHKLMAFMGHTDIKSSLHYVHLNVDDIRDGMGVGV